jgi:hypothetical protein
MATGAALAVTALGGRALAAAVEPAVGSPEADAKIDRVCDVGRSLVDQIEEAEAKTFDGLMVKVSAIGWCREHDPFEIPVGNARTPRPICVSSCRSSTV